MLFCLDISATYMGMFWSKQNYSMNHDSFSTVSKLFTVNAAVVLACFLICLVSGQIGFS